MSYKDHHRGRLARGHDVNDGRQRNKRSEHRMATNHVVAFIFAAKRIRNWFRVTEFCFSSVVVLISRFLQCAFIKFKFILDISDIWEIIYLLFLMFKGRNLA